jgi:hypothetical protein
MGFGVFDAIDLDLTKFPVELPAPIQALIWQYKSSNPDKPWFLQYVSFFFTSKFV